MAMSRVWVWSICVPRQASGVARESNGVRTTRRRDAIQLYCSCIRTQAPAYEWSRAPDKWRAPAAARARTVDRGGRAVARATQPRTIAAQSRLQGGEVTTMSAAGHIDPSNKKVALLIAVLALVLAFSETLGKSAQTDGAQPQHRGVEPVDVLPGEDGAPDDDAHGGGERRARGAGGDGRSERAYDKQIEAGRRPPRATTRSPRPTRAARSSPRAPRPPRRSATARSPRTTTTRSPRARCRSGSCSRRPRSSPP